MSKAATPAEAHGHALVEAGRIGEAQEAGDVRAHADAHDLPGAKLEAAFAVDAQGGGVLGVERRDRRRTTPGRTRGFVWPRWGASGMSTISFASG